LWQTAAAMVQESWDTANNMLANKTAETSEKIKGLWENMKEDLKLITDTFVGDMTQAFKNLAKNTMSAFEAIWRKGEKFTDKLKEAFRGFVDAALSALENLVANIITSAIKTILAKKLEAIASVIASVMASVPFPFSLAVVGGAIAAVAALFSALHLAEGGLVTKPTLALVGEAGPELVVPLHKAKDFVSGEQGTRIENANITVSLNLPNVRDPYSARQLKEDLLLNREGITETLIDMLRG